MRILRLVRRITPIGAAGIALGLAAATVAAGFGLDALGRARAELALLESRAQAGSRQPSPLLPEGLSYAAQDRAAAQMAMLTAIRSAAAERRLLLEQVAPGPKSDAAELSIDVIVSGPEADVLHMVRRLEAGRPAIRFAFWRLARTGPSEPAIRLEARALGWWEPR